MHDWLSTGPISRDALKADWGQALLEQPMVAGQPATIGDTQPVPKVFDETVKAGGRQPDPLTVQKSRLNLASLQSHGQTIG